MRKSSSMRAVMTCALAISATLVLMLLASPSAGAKTHRAAAKTHKIKGVDPTIYDSTVSPSPGNLPSMSYEASALAQFGNQITFGGSARVLNNVVVQLSSWGCQSGSWTGSPSSCSTSPGATFTEPITLNVYTVGRAGVHGPSTVGTLIATDTQTFAIPYRPSADPADCSNSPDNGTQWYDAPLAKCFNGYLTDVEFSFGHVALPNTVIYGIAYNTSDWGAHPYGDATACHTSSGGCGYDSLNVGLSDAPTAPSVGSDTYPGTTYLDVVNAGYESNYCDGGAAGINEFRIDEPANYPTGNGTTSGCWSVNGNNTSPWYVPTVKFNAVNTSAPLITSANHAAAVAGEPFSFTITTTGVPAPTVKLTRRLPKGLSFVANNNGTGTISGTALKTDRSKTYLVTIKARSTDGKSTQRPFALTLTGGKT